MEHCYIHHTVAAVADVLHVHDYAESRHKIENERVLGEEGWLF